MGNDQRGGSQKVDLVKQNNNLCTV